jgi:hypothetical protein
MQIEENEREVKASKKEGWLYHPHVPVCAAWVHMYFSKNFFQSVIRKDGGEGVSLYHAYISHEAL